MSRPEHEMGPEGAELDALRAAWKALEAPPAELESAGVDERTRALLEQLRASWRALAPPPPRLPFAWRARRAQPLAWAAALLAASALALWAFARAGRSGEAARARGAAGEALLAQHGAAQNAPGAPPADSAALAIAALEPGRMELRGRALRIVLVEEQPAREPQPSAPGAWPAYAPASTPSKPRSPR